MKKLQKRFDGETYIVVNEHGSIFRFSKAESLFLLRQNSRLRTAAINLFIKPMFSNFIMLVIMFNCACMVLENPPHWIDDYLEYVFTAIYIAEATVKIIARGFVLHNFSYLRDPWNWLDFIVIVSAVATEIIKAILQSTMLGQIAVLRTFRVLRALKTMSVVPGLRGIVKALLRSIHALKDAVALTVFCVSVFALIGYQLFHGTLRQKCVLNSGTFDLAPNALYAIDRRQDIFNWDMDINNFTSTLQDYNTSTNSKVSSSHSAMTPLYQQQENCNTLRTLPECDGTSWCMEDADFITRILTLSNKTLASMLNASEPVCSVQSTLHLNISVRASLLHKAGLHISSQINDTLSQENWNYSTSNPRNFESPSKYNVTVQVHVADTLCLERKLNGSSLEDVTSNKSRGEIRFTHNERRWLPALTFGNMSVAKWQHRYRMMLFRIAIPDNSSISNDLLIYVMDPKAQSNKAWKNDVENYCMSEPSTGLYYFPLSSNRPSAEPIYCAIGHDDMCPLGYSCNEAGDNPDFGYTSFDHFFLAFLTSFRLVALDSWSRLYYLTLHTIGKTYAIFYILVVLLGSYYLVNLILAVVYMAYEEQQAVVEEEELEAKEREAEKREQEGSDMSESDENESCSEAHSSEIDVETGRWKLGLITTSLACHEPRSMSNDGNSSPTLSPSPFGYRESCRRKRRKMRLRSQMSSRNTLPTPSDEEASYRRPRFKPQHPRSRRSSSFRHSIRSRRIPSSDTCTCSDDSSMYQYGDAGARKRRRPTSKGRRRRYRRKSPINLETQECPKTHNGGAALPNIRLIVTEIDSDREKDRRSSGFSANSNFLSVNSAFSRGRSSVSSETSSVVSYGLCKICSKQNAVGKHACNNPGCSNSKHFFPSLLPVRRLSETSSAWGDNESEQIVEAEIAQNECELSQKSSLRLPLINVIDHPSYNSVKLNTTLLEPTRNRDHRLSASSMQLQLPTAEKKSKERSAPPPVTQNKQRNRSFSDGAGLSVFTTSNSKKPNFTDAEEDCDYYISDNKYGMGPAEYFQANNNLLSPVNPSPEKFTGVSISQEKEDHTIAVISEDGKYYEYQNSYNAVQLEDKMEDTTMMLNQLESTAKSKREKWKLKNKRVKDKYRKLSRAFVNTFCKWRCCPASWSKIQRKVRKIVLNPFTDLLITLCIALNTLFMSLEHHPMETWFSKLLDQANVFFTIVFTVEMLMKIIGLSPYTYFKERWNVFDAVVVLFSLLELLISSTQGLSVFRAFRLMRILKLAKQWPTLNKLLRIIGRTLGQLWHLTLVLFLVLFIFAVVGMQLLRDSYLTYYNEHNQGKQPRWNFVDFSHSFMVVFRIQCGEWVENMFNCINVASPGVCIPLFILVYIIGNLVILNLFLALLLNSFSGDVLQQTTSKNSSISEAFRRFAMWARRQRIKIQNIPFNTFCCQMVKLGVRNTPKNPINPLKNDVRKSMSQQTDCSVITNTETTFMNAANKKDNNIIANECADEVEPLVPPVKVPTLNGNANHEDQPNLSHANNHCCDELKVKPTSMSEHEPPKEQRLKVKHRSRQLSTCSSLQSDSTMSKLRTSRTTSLDSRPESRRAHRKSRVSETNSVPVSPEHTVGRSRLASIKARERYRGMCSSGGETSTGERDCMLDRKSPNGISNKSINQDNRYDEEIASNKEQTEEIENKKEKVKVQPCFSCWKSEPTSGAWFEIRRFVNKIIIHQYFENFVIFCILISTVTLAMEDIHIDKRPAMKRVVQIVDIFCCIFFTIEMLMKWIGKGLKSYFTNPWCCLDFFIVIVSIINLSLVANQRSDFSALRALRTFRALRPLRALSRFQGMKIVVDALVRAVPSITQVFVICMIFWLIFSILGVNIFGGRFGRCVSLLSGDIMPNPPLELGDMNNSIYDTCYPNNTLLLDYLNQVKTAKDVSPLEVLPIIRNKNECDLCANMMNTTLINWQIPNVNFDSAPRGLLALLQIATFTGWLEIMGSAVDITGIESQPRYEASFYNYLYFCVFIIFGAFFSLNLFIGVIIDNFNQQKIKTTGGEDGVFLTDEQRRYYNAMKRMASKTPKKPIPRPNSRFANKIYDIVTDRKFEIAVMGLIMLNLVVMAIEHHDMSPKMYRLLQNFNLGFICIFLLEAILKLIGLRLYYFTVPWNVFDILVVVVSLIVNCISTASGLQDVMTQYFVQPTIFRIIRLFRVTRILRLIREAKGIRTLLFALMMSLPALFNIGSLLFLLMFIYAIIGMSQFPYIQKVAGVDSLLNFETFPNAFLVLFQISTSEGWDTFIEPVLRDREPYCVEKPEDGSPSNCGNSTIGVIYFVTYVMITFLIVVNMYIAIILENFEVATRESAEPLTADDFEQFFEVWQRFDDRLTQYVTYDQLKSLLNQLDYPLRVAHPNGAFISQAHMKVTLDGNIHCLEVIITLIKKVLGDSPELSNLKDSMLQSFQLKCPTKESLEDQETIDSEEFTVRLRAVLIIQQAYRDYRLRQEELEYSDDDSMTETSSSSLDNDVSLSQSHKIDQTRKKSIEPPG